MAGRGRSGWKRATDSTTTALSQKANYGSTISHELEPNVSFLLLLLAEGLVYLSLKRDGILSLLPDGNPRSRLFTAPPFNLLKRRRPGVPDTSSTLNGRRQLRLVVGTD